MILKHSYSDNIFNKKLLIIGLNPPPLGGISVHIKRVIKKFLNQKNSVLLIDVVKESDKRSKLQYLIYLIKTIYYNKPEMIYYHTLSLRKFPFELGILLILKFFLSFQVIIVDHTPRFFYQKSWIYKKIVNIFLHYVDQQILVGNSTYNAYVKNNILIKSNVSVESPFLKPNEEEYEIIFDKYPQGLKDFINAKSNLILINGSSARLWQNVDLYGFDMALNMFEDLQKKYINCGLIVVIAEIGDTNYFRLLTEKIKYNKDIYLLFNCSHEIWPLMKKVDVFIRPTANDAYGISIEEALIMNIPAIASNVCKRPLGTILFESRNQIELNRAVENTFNSSSFCSKNLQK